MKMIPIGKPYLTEDEAQSAYDTILSGWVMQGPKVEEFEQKFCEYTGAKFAVAVSNGTCALHLAMIAEGIGGGDEVICPSMSFIATANCIRYTGAKPVFAEVDSSYNIDASFAEKLITKKTKAILIVHQLGMPADIDAFRSLCGRYNLKLIEDAACAVGSAYKEKKIGSHSGIVCFSFHPRKVITTGEGGMITTSDKEIYERIKSLRQHSISVNSFERHKSGKIIYEEHLETGYNFRMTDIQASIGIRQLEKLDWLVGQRRKIAMKYIDGLQSIEFIRLPVEPKGYFSNYQSFSIYIKKESRIERNELLRKLNDTGISAARGVATIHREPAYKKEYSDIRLEVSEDLSDRSLLIPVYAQMSGDEVNYVSDNLKKFLG